MIEVVCSENGNSEKRSYPFIVRDPKNGDVVIATGDKEGFALSGYFAFKCDSYYVNDWKNWDNKDDWEILPAGTTITLTVK